MYRQRPFTDAVIQGDIYPHIQFAIPNLTSNASAFHGEAAGFTLSVAVSHKWGIVVSHSCDVNAETGRPSDRVLVAEVNDFSDYTRRLVESKGGYEKLNPLEVPKLGEILYFPGMFYLVSDAALGGHDHWVDLTMLRVIERKRLTPSEKLVELSDQYRESLRLKLALHFGRNEIDESHP